MWDAPPALAALVKRVYVSMVGSRRDHSVCAVGRSGTGKTTACQAFTHALLKLAGTTGEKMSGEYGGCADPSCPPSLQMVDPSVLFPPPVERVQAMFTVLKSFGCVNSQHSDASSRFAMVFSLDFNHAGQAAAGHLQARNTHTNTCYTVDTHTDTILTSSSSNQTMMLDKWKVCHTTPGESNFLVFSQMLAGISTEMR